MLVGLPLMKDVAEKLPNLTSSKPDEGDSFHRLIACFTSSRTKFEYR